jgi:hypothetical protein
VGSRIFETYIRLAPDDRIHSLFSDLSTKYTNNLAELAGDPAANFPVQRILERLRQPEDVKTAVPEILRFTKEIIGAKLQP